MHSSKEDVRNDQFFGHSANAEGVGVAELLREHLRRVAEQAGRFAAAFGAEEQGHAAGMLHDLGKYADQFQRRLRDPSERGRDHWTIGALALLTLGRLGILPACATAAHHTGLRQLPTSLRSYWTEITKALTDENRRGEFTNTNGTLLRQRFFADGFEMPKVTRGLCLTGQFAADMLDMRMFFSALVDADYLATEAHFSGDAKVPYRPREEGPTLDLDLAMSAIDTYLAEIRRKQGDDPMAGPREALYADCVAAAGKDQGLFTLSAPTGSGKTLAMLSFALRHARTFGMRRVILVVPFLNIIDQTAAIYRTIFSMENGFHRSTVLEHHSLADRHDEPPNDELESDVGNMLCLLAENWDAPIILTTTVQFFESLMADRTSRCRKLHRLAQSIILFDEVQTLPPALAVATLATVSRLSDPKGPFRSTVVFATATQPAFDSFNQRIAPEFAVCGWQPTEIVADAQSLYAATADRIHIQWRHNTKIPLDDITLELQEHKQVLCIVNLKRHAASLIAVLRERKTEGLLHLSTNMCPAHRAETLTAVHERLRQGLPICLVATQCVEAGVDLDFPVVYRALAPLDAIAQAAGRCNRHGRGPRGQVIIFKPRDNRSLYPPGYGEAVDATESFLKYLSTQADLDATEILCNPEQLRNYYRRFYRLTGKDSTESDRERPLLDAIRGGDFAEVAKLYKLIQQDTIRVLVPYKQPIFEQLSGEVENVEQFTPKFIRDWIRRASPHAVNLFRPQGKEPIAPYLEPIQFSHRRTVEAWEAEWFYTLPDVKYDPLLGISTDVENLWIV